MEVRVKGALPRMTAFKNVMEEKGVTHLAAICAIIGGVALRFSILKAGVYAPLLPAE